ncbi:hypothetical protein AAC387_Pa11g0089 [Persea americana]
MAMAGTGAGLSCVLQNLQSKLDELERPLFFQKEKQTSLVVHDLERPRLGERQKQTPLIPHKLERPGFGEKEKQTSLVVHDLERLRLGGKEKRTPQTPFVRRGLERPRFGDNEKSTLGSCLSAIAAVLQDAERRQLNETAVRYWLRNLKDAVYYAEERVDKIVIEVLEMKATNRYSSHYIQQFSFRFEREMQELMIRFRHITNEMNRFHFKEGFVETQPPISMTRQTSSWSYAIESELYARDCEKQKLIDPLINFENKEEVPSVLPVVGVGMGMGGMGKTTLARLVFHDERIIAHFDLRMWVSVTEADSDVPSLVKKILESAVGAYVYHPSSSSSDLVLQTQLQEKLHGKRYLLVLDGVWNEERYKWNRLKACLKCGAMGSRILATTRSDTVASITGTLPRHDLGRLSKEQSWSLFQKLAKPHPDFLSIGKKMVDRCGGDVLAVKTLGGLMFTKTTKEEWESVRSSDFWKPQGNDREILPALKMLPKEMRRMISLRHIEFDVAKKLHLPSGIGELTCLRTLPKFVVGKRRGSGIEELKCLNQISGDIRIEGLDNISNGACACEANLKGKQHLHSLELSWPSVEAVAGTRRKAKEVIENLEPHSNLKKLVLENYVGLSLPSWMMVLSNLVDIKLSHCNGCEHLPPLGQLCFLKSLKIEEMSAVKYVVEFDGSHNYKGAAAVSSFKPS